MIPVCTPKLPGNELEYVTDCIKTNWISSMGKYVTQFEEEFAHYCGVNYGVAVCNGTVALHLALASLGIGKGDEVIIPDFTMIATANAVLYTGAKPVFVDSELKTWNINPYKIEEKISSKTKVIIPVHTYGHPAEMDVINDIAKKHNLYVVEDAAEAHGAEYYGRRAGSLGDIGCFSFYGNKILTTGEGGMLVTDDKLIADTARSLRNHTLDDSKRRFKHDLMGFNYRLTNIQAAIGVAQLERAEELVNTRINNAFSYNTLLKYEKVVLPPCTPNIKNVYWMYSILVEDAENTAKKMKELGVDTRPFFYPMHKQPMFKGKYKGTYPVSNELSKRGLNLPSSPNLTDKELAKVAEVVSKSI